MTDWISIGIGAVINASLTIVLALIFFPLFFLGPIIGGFVTIYLIRDEFESRRTFHVRAIKIEDFESGIIHGGLAGGLGGIIVGILSLFGVGIVATMVGLLLAELGVAVGAIGTLFVILFTVITMIVCGVLSAIGGAIGEYIQSAGKGQYEDY